MKFTRNTVAWGLLLTLCLVVIGTADTTAQEKKAVSDLTDGAWALQFQINSHFTVQSFEGTTFSLKKFTGDRTAWRAGLSLNLSTQDDDQTGFSDTLISPTYTVDNNAFSVNAVIHRVFYTAPRSKTAFFFGVGPTGGYGHAKLSQRRDYPDGRFTSAKREDNSWSAGLSAVMGVEWFLRRNLSLLAEYGTVIEYTHNKRTTTNVTYDLARTRVTQQETISKRFQFDDQAVKFGFSLYF
jgi:opacity protein-like surface antigen